MPSLRENLGGRIRKLLKPSNAQQAFQPVLETISNAIMAIEDSHSDPRSAQVSVTVENLGSDDVRIEVRDNGIGLDEAHFAAFLELDTEFKRSRGGKGVGRLYWLDAFQNIRVESRYVGDDGRLTTRAFEFVLDDVEQVRFVEPAETWSNGERGTVVRFRGLRSMPYVSNFPKQAGMVVDHTAGEFIASFLTGAGPKVILNIHAQGGKTVVANFPHDIASLVAKGPLEVPPFEIEGLGEFQAQVFLCDARASRGAGFRHALHLLGNGRTVETRKIDDLLGLRSLVDGGAEDLRLHVVVSSAFLDERTAESRTAFTITETDKAAITRTIVDHLRDGLLKEQFEAWDCQRRDAFQKFLVDQPIFAFSDPDVLFESVPRSAIGAEHFVSALSVVRMRRENEREKRLSELVTSLVTGEKVPEEFPKLVSDAAQEIQANERASLAHHAARRKVVLDLLDQLIRRIREATRDEDIHHLERTLHSLLVPMRVRGDGPVHLERSAHDLWIIDERLTYAAGFSSDLELRKTIQGSTSADRPDVLLWDVGFGLGPIEEPYGGLDVDDHLPLSRVFIVELKKPGRAHYGPTERIEDQIVKYVRQLQGGVLESFGRRRIRVSPDCRFYCMVVADIRGQLEEGELFAWDPIDNGAGRRRDLGKIHTVIDVVDWSDVLSSAKDRNRALLSMAGLKMRATTAFARSEDPTASGI